MLALTVQRDTGTAFGLCKMMYEMESCIAEEGTAITNGEWRTRSQTNTAQMAQNGGDNSVHHMVKSVREYSSGPNTDLAWTWSVKNNIHDQVNSGYCGLFCSKINVCTTRLPSCCGMRISQVLCASVFKGTVSVGCHSRYNVRSLNAKWEDYLVLNNVLFSGSETYTE